MKSRYLFACFFACFALLSCDKDQQESINQGSGQETFLPMTDIDIHPLGDKLTFSYTSHYAWTLKCNVDWLKVTPTSGSSGTTTVTIEASPNVDEKRTATVNFCNNSGSVLDSFDVTQFEAVINILIDRASRTDAEAYEYKTDGSAKVNFDWKQSRKGAGFKVESNIEWEIDIDDNVRYLLKDGSNQVVSQKYGTVTDDPVQKTFNLSARNHNLNDEVFVRQVTVIPRKVNVSGNEEKLSDNVIESLTRTITISQDNLIFYLDGLTESTTVADSYKFDVPFTELGNDYLKNNRTADSAPGEQIFHLVYEEGKVAFANGSWGALKKDESLVLSNGDIMKCIDEVTIDVKSSLQASSVGDETQEVRKCTRKQMSLIVPAPNKTQLTVDPAGGQTAHTTTKVITLPLVVNGKTVSEIMVDYSQNKYELFLDSNGGKFSNLGGVNQKQTVKVRTKGPWKLKPSAAWLTVPAKGVGTQDAVSLYASDQNLNFIENNASLTLSTDFVQADPQITASNSPVFTQEPFVFNIDSDIYDLEKGITIGRLNTDSHNLTFTSSGPWKLRLESSDNDVDWLTAGFAANGRSIAMTSAGKDALSGTAGTWTIVFKAVNPNRSAQPRKMDVFITSDYHEGKNVPQAKKTLGITQKQYYFNIDASSLQKSSISAYQAGDFTFQVDCGAPWRIMSCPEWVDQISPVEGDGKSDDPVFVKVRFKDNTGEKWQQTRSGVFKIRSYDSVMTMPDDPEYQGDDRSFSVEQDAFVFDVSAEESYSLGSLDTKANDFKVSSTAGASWTITTGKNSSWVTPSVSQGTGTQNVSFSLGENGTLEKRKDTVIVSSGVVDKTVTFEVEQGEYRFNSETVTFDEFAELSQPATSFNVDCLGPWTIQNCPDWITLSKMSGSGSSSEVAVTVEPHDNTGEYRQGSFLVQSVVGGVKHSKTINVSQKNFVWEKTESPEDINLGPLQSGTYSLKFKSSGAWKAEVIDDLGKFPIDLYAESGLGGRDNEEVLTFTVPANYLTSARKATVVVTSLNDASKTYRVSVNQNKYDFKLDKSSVPGCKELGDSFNVNVECSGKWNVDFDESVSYLEIYPTSGTGNGSFTVTVKPNYAKTERSADINVRTSDDSGLLEVVHISQNAYIFDVDHVSSRTLTAKAQDYEFDVACSGEWEVECDMAAQAFLTATPSETDGNGKVRISVGLNNATTAREGKITVRSKDNPQLEKVITISQEGYIFNAENKGKSSFDAAGGTFTIGLQSTGGWIITECSDFLTVSESMKSGNGDSEIAVDVLFNKTDASRTGKVVISSTDNSESITIEITQAGYVWNITADSMSAVPAAGGTYRISISCTGSWTLTPDAAAQAFVTIQSMTGTGTADVAVTVASNKKAEGAAVGTAERTGNITVSTTDGSNKVQVIEIKQFGEQ